MSEKLSRGYVLFSRDTLGSSLWQLSPDHLRVALYLLIKARHSERPHKLLDGTMVSRGQLVTSMSRIAEDCSYYENRTSRQWSRQKADRIVKNLENIGFILVNSNSNGTLITICNYDIYQSSSNYNSDTCVQLPCNDRATDVQLPCTNKKGKNGNNEKNIDYQAFLAKFNKAAGKNCRIIDAKAKRQLKARLAEGFTMEEILRAIKNCAADSYHVEHKRYLTPEFITRGDKLQKYLTNQEPQRAKNNPGNQPDNPDNI